MRICDMPILIKPLKVNIDPESRGFEIQGMQKSKLFDGKDARDVVLQTIRPHKIRGNHYHIKKFEWFLPVRGSAVLTWFDRDDSNPQKGTELMTADFQNPKLFEIQPNTCHLIENETEEDFYMLTFSTEDYDPADTKKC